MPSTKTTSSQKKTTGYLEFYSFQFKRFHADPANRGKKLSVPQAGQLIGAQWRALNSAEQQVWFDLANKLNKKRGSAKHANSNPVRTVLTRLSAKHAQINNH